jgi:hypothetical protein
LDAVFDRTNIAAPSSKTAAIASRAALTASGSAPPNAQRAKMAAAPTAICAPPRTMYGTTV